MKRKEKTRQAVEKSQSSEEEGKQGAGNKPELKSSGKQGKEGKKQREDQKSSDRKSKQ